MLDWIEEVIDERMRALGETEKDKPRLTIRGSRKNRFR